MPVRCATVSTARASQPETSIASSSVLADPDTIVGSSVLISAGGRRPDAGPPLRAVTGAHGTRDGIPSRSSSSPDGSLPSASAGPKVEGGVLDRPLGEGSPHVAGATVPADRQGGRHVRKSFVAAAAVVLVTSLATSLGAVQTSATADPPHNPGGPCSPSRTRTSASRALRATQNVEKALDRIERTSNGLVSVASAGMSGECRDLLYATVGDGPTTFWLHARIHGNELHSTEAVLQILDHLASGDPRAQLIREQLTVIVIPMYNPDGAEANIRQSTTPTRIDLNRDWENFAQPESVAFWEVVVRDRTRARPRPAPHGRGACRQRHRRPQPVPDRRPVDRPVPDDGRAVADQPADGNGERRRPRPVRPRERCALPDHRHHQRRAEPDADELDRTRGRGACGPDANQGRDLLRGPGRWARRATASSSGSSRSRRWRCSPPPRTARSRRTTLRATPLCRSRPRAGRGSDRELTGVWPRGAAAAPCRRTARPGDLGRVDAWDAEPVPIAYAALQPRNAGADERWSRVRHRRSRPRR